MRLYTMHKKQWENELTEIRNKKFQSSKSLAKSEAKAAFVQKRIQSDPTTSKIATKKRKLYEDSDSE